MKTETPTPHEKIQSVVSLLGISPVIQAKAMRINPKSVEKKRNLNKDKFNENNFQDLKRYILGNIPYLESL